MREDTSVWAKRVTQGKGCSESNQCPRLRTTASKQTKAVARPNNKRKEGTRVVLLLKAFGHKFTGLLPDVGAVVNSLKSSTPRKE